MLQFTNNNELLEIIRKDYDSQPIITNYFDKEALQCYLEILRITDRLQIKKHGNILDVGTGLGVIPIALTAKGFGHVYATDRIISSIIDNKNTKKIRLFIWE